MSESTADRLMRLASEADLKADGYAGTLADRPLIDNFERESLLERIGFYRGQASGFRQSAYYAAILEGVRPHD